MPEKAKGDADEDQDKRPQDPAVKKENNVEVHEDSEIVIKTFDEGGSGHQEQYDQEAENEKLKAYVEQQRRKKAYKRQKDRSVEKLRRDIRRDPNWSTLRVTPKDKEREKTKSIIPPVIGAVAGVGLLTYIVLKY